MSFETFTTRKSDHPADCNLSREIASIASSEQVRSIFIKPKCNLSGLSFFALYKTKQSSACATEERLTPHKKIAVAITLTIMAHSFIVQH
jgi:hypothetical protein